MSFFTIVFFGILACAQQATATQRVETDPRIATELVEVEAQIKDAEAQDAKYAGGLVKTLIAARLEVLKQTRVLLQQRAKAQDLNVALRYTVVSCISTPNRTTSCGGRMLQNFVRSSRTGSRRPFRYCCDLRWPGSFLTADFFTVSDSARAIGVSSDTIRKWTNSGRL